MGGDAKGKGPGSFSNIPSPPCLVMQAVEESEGKGAMCPSSMVSCSHLGSL